MKTPVTGITLDTGNGLLIKSSVQFSSVQYCIYALGNDHPSLRRFPSVALETISVLLWFMMALSQLFKEDILHLALLLSTPRSPCDQWCDVPPDTYIYNRVYLRIFITECICALCMCCTLYVSFSVSVSSFFLALSLSLLVTSNSQLKTHYM